MILNDEDVSTNAELTPKKPRLLIVTLVLSMAGRLRGHQLELMVLPIIALLHNCATSMSLMKDFVNSFVALIPPKVAASMKSQGALLKKLEPHFVIH